MKARIIYSMDSSEWVTEIKTIEDLVKYVGLHRACKVDVISREELEIVIYSDWDD